MYALARTPQLRRRALALALCAAAALCVPSAAASARGARLARPSDRARWSGQLSNGATPDPSLCDPSRCPARALDVALGRRAWPHRSGGLLVALHWNQAYLDVGYDLDLYVYGPGGRLAAHSAIFMFSTDEAAWVQNPGNGPYRIQVVPRALVGTLRYTIVAGFQRGYTVRERATPHFPGSDGADFVALGRRPRRARTALPDLLPGKPSNFHMETAIGGHFYVTGWRGLSHPPSCYAQETAGLDADEPARGPAGALRCLRWSKVLENRGSGPFELRSYRSDRQSSIYQAVYDSGGRYRERLVPNAQYYVHHGRVRVAGFDETTLRAIKSDGAPGRVVARMGDTGWCKGDTQNAGFARSPDGPARYGVPGTCDSYDWTDDSSTVHPGDLYVRTGISPRWLDTAPWALPDQYIDVTRVPDGRYLMVERINTAGTVRESSRRNDTAVACVRLERDTATACPTPRR